MGIYYKFSTEKGNLYIYDACTNYVYPISPYIEKRINRGSDGIDLAKLKNLIIHGKEKEYAFFDNNKLKMWDFLPEEEYCFKHDNLQQMILETTQKCNLRCRYCIYRDEYKKARFVSNKEMSWKVAKKSIDYFTRRLLSPYNKVSLPTKAAFSFYGGEPIINFNLIDKCVNYIRSTTIKDKIQYFITTNGTLIDNKIADFFIKNDFSLLISLDGPQEENDKNRVYKNGKGTFSSIIKNLKTIQNLNRYYFKRRVSFNAVYTYDTDLFRVIHYFVRLKKEIRMPIKVTFSFDATEIRKETNIVKKHYVQINKLRNLYIDILKNRTNYDKNKDLFYFLEKFFKQDLQRFRNRSYIIPSQLELKSATCIPGVARLYVDVDGNFHMCERISHAFKIGDFRTGVSYPKVKEIYDQYKHSVMKECKQCIAMHFCRICAAVVGKNDGIFNIEGYCEEIRESFKSLITTYYSILEDNPKVVENHIIDEEMIYK